MVVWIDGKNPTLYSSGISAWLKGILTHLEERELHQAVLITP